MLHRASSSTSLHPACPRLLVRLDASRRQTPVFVAAKTLYNKIAKEGKFKKNKKNKNLEISGFRGKLKKCMFLL